MPPLQQTHTHTRREGLAYTKHLHTAGFGSPFHTRPRPLLPPPTAGTALAKPRVQKANSPVRGGISSTCQPEKCFSGCEVAGTLRAADRQSHKRTARGVQTTPSHTRTHAHTHATAFQQLFGSVLAHFSSLVQTQPPPKLPFFFSQSQVER